MLLSAFLPFVLTHVTHCPEPTAEQAIRLSAIEFAKRTSLWVETQSPIVQDTTGQTAFTFSLSTFEADQLPQPPARQSEVFKLRDVWVNDRPMMVTDRGTAVTLAQRNQAHDLAYRTSGSTFTVLDAPVVGESIVTHGVLVPTVECESFPDDVFGEYLEVIASGALWRLLKIPKQDWTDLNASQIALGQFNDQTQTVAFRAERGFGAGMPRARVQLF